MTEMSSSAAPAQAVGWRVWARRTLLWAAACFLLAVSLSMIGSGLGFPSYLLTLVAGSLCGVAFVRATLVAKHPRTGALVHVGGAILFGGALLLAVQGRLEIPDSIPELPRVVLLLAQIAAAPGIAWVVLTLMWRVSDLARRPSTRSRSQPPRVSPPLTERPEADVVEFSAVPLRLRSLGWLIVGVIVVFGSLLGAVLIGVDWFFQITSTPAMIIAAGGLIALPAYLLLSALLRRRTLPCRVQFGGDEVTVTMGVERRTFAYRELTELIWRCDTDYARVVLRGRGQDLSVMVGIARPPRGVAARLPELSATTRRRLEGAGLVLQAGQRDGVMRFIPGAGANRATSD